MTSTPQREYDNGYDRGRNLSLTKGIVQARIWLQQHPQTKAYTSGFAAAVWDWEDANGLPHDPPLYSA